MLLEGGDSGGATVIGVHSAGGGGGSTVHDVLAGSLRCPPFRLVRSLSESRHVLTPSVSR